MHLQPRHEKDRYLHTPTLCTLDTSLQDIQGTLETTEIQHIEKHRKPLMVHMVVLG